MPQSSGSQMNGQAISNNASMVELDHAIGFSGKVDNSVFFYLFFKDFVLIAGSSIVAGDLNDPHSQHFLTAHDDLITCIAISNDGSLLASGK